MKLRAVDRKMLRDLWSMKGQAIAIAFVVVAGVTTYVSMISTYDTLEVTLERYYREYRFAEGFASVRRAPDHVAERLRRVAGIGEVETRVVAEVNLEVPDFPDPVTGRIISLPAGRQPSLDRLHVREGRLVGAGREDEVLVNEAFAEAHGLALADSLTAIISGRRRTLTVVGVASSPPYLMAADPAAFFPDPERFGVLWMDRSALAAAYDMEGAFNHVSFTLAPGASIEAVTARVDLVLDRYGAVGAHGRDEQHSHALMMEQFDQLEGIAALLPFVFLAVAAFLLNIVVTRLIRLQREQIAVLKAFGYRDLDVGLHYVKLVLIIAVAGVIGGTALGVWAGRATSDLFLEYFHFPYLDYTLRPAVVATAVVLTTIASTVGVVRSVRQAVRLPPAEAMRPPPPPVYRATIVERIGLHRALDQPTRIILRNLERQPLKAFLTVLGIAAACAILITGLFFGDVVDHMVRTQYGLAQRENVTVTFVEPRSRSALHELRALPGVQFAEPFRSVPVRLRHGHRSYDVAIEGTPTDAHLRRIIDTDLRPVPVPPEVIMLADRLADILRVRPGDQVEVEVMEGRRRTHNVTVTGLAEQYIGLATYMELTALNRLVGEGRWISGAHLLIDERHEAALNQSLRDRPDVASIVSLEDAIAGYMDTAAETLLAFTFILTLFAGIIAFGVVYNSMRISLSERDRELASMRVLGFRRREVSYILLGEAALLVLLAIPLGFVLGVGLAHLAGTVWATDVFALPVVLTRATFGTAAVIVILSAVVSGLMVRRRLNRLDLIGVLKTRE